MIRNIEKERRSRTQVLHSIILYDFFFVLFINFHFAKFIFTINHLLLRRINKLKYGINLRCVIVAYYVAS